MHSSVVKLLGRSACILAVLWLAACTKNYSAYALTSTGTIIQFNTNSPGTILNEATVNGLSSGQSLVQLDYQPSDGTLYGLTSDNELATVDPSSGTAAVVGSQFTTDTLTSPVMSFDPVEDQIRVITSQYNLRVSPQGSLIATGTQVAYDSQDTNANKTPQLVGIAYSNHSAGVSSTTLYALDMNTQDLVVVGDQNAGDPGSADQGLLHTVGPTGVNFNAEAAINVEIANGTIYAALQQSGAGASLYTLDGGGGQATLIGTIDNDNRTIISLVVVPD